MNTTFEESSVLSDILLQHNATPSQMREATGCGVNTSSRWLSGEHTPSYDRVRALIHCNAGGLSLAARAAVLADLAGRDFVVIPRGESVTGDVNGDGQTDIHDLHHTGPALLSHVCTLVELCNAAFADGKLERREAAAITSKLADLKLTANESLAAVHETLVERKAARPLTFARA